MLIGAVFLFVFVRVDRIPLPYVAVPALILVLVFVSGSIQSIGRLILPAFPNYWILAKRGSWLGRVGWPVASTVAPVRDLDPDVRRLVRAVSAAASAKHAAGTGRLAGRRRCSAGSVPSLSLPAAHSGTG